jgi:hypothetical protein
VAECPNLGTGISPYSGTCEICSYDNDYMFVVQVDFEEVVIFGSSIASSKYVQMVLELHHAVV